MDTPLTVPFPLYNDDWRIKKKMSTKPPRYHIWDQQKTARISKTINDRSILFADLMLCPLGAQYISLNEQKKIGVAFYG